MAPRPNDPSGDGGTGSRPPGRNPRGTGSSPAWATDERAFEALFREEYDLLCVRAARLLGSREHAEDVVQGVFAWLWKERERLEVDDIRAYLYSAVRRRALGELRRIAVRRRAEPMLSLESTGRPAPPDAELEAEELRQRFRRALEALPPRTRQAFELSRGEGRSYDQIALKMGISPKTVGVHVANALAAVRRAFGIDKPRRGK